VDFLPLLLPISHPHLLKTYQQVYYAVHHLGLLSNRWMIWSVVGGIVLTFLIGVIPGVNGIFGMRMVDGVSWACAFPFSLASNHLPHSPACVFQGYCSGAGFRSSLTKHSNIFSGDSSRLSPEGTQTSNHLWLDADPIFRMYVCVCVWGRVHALSRRIGDNYQEQKDEEGGGGAVLT
jgi:hypothetical protein